MLDKPILAPGKNSGGNKLSNIKDIKLNAVNMPIVATRLALNFGNLDSLLIIPLGVVTYYIIYTRAHNVNIETLKSIVNFLTNYADKY